MAVVSPEQHRAASSPKRRAPRPPSSGRRARPPPRRAVLAAIAAAAACGGTAAGADEAPFALPAFRFRSADASRAAHRSLGEAIGTRFAEGIRLRLEQWPSLQRVLLPALRRPEGRAIYEAFLRVHTDAFPDYMEELLGMARGARVPFESVFTAQIEQEFAAQLGRLEGGPSAPSAAWPAPAPALAPDHCSDYMLCSSSLCAGAHNEDNDAQSINRTFMADVQLGGPSGRFRALVYMGELPSGAFGVNARGVGFSLNWVGPPPADAPGLGRGFISRSLLDATGAADAVARATVKGQGGGHNIQLFDFCARGIQNIELAQDRHSIRRIGDSEGPFFHANQYQTLHVPGQVIGPSSSHRLARVAALPRPRSLREMLHVLGDQADQSYPIFHDSLSHARGELSDWTLATAVFDLDNRTLAVLAGNPRAGRARLVLSVAELLGPGGCPGEGAMFV